MKGFGKKLSSTITGFTDKSGAVRMITKKRITKTARMHALMGMHGQAPIVTAIGNLARLAIIGNGTFG